MTKIAVLGGTGKMGTAFVEAVAASPGLSVSSRIGREGDLESAIQGCDVLVDFSTPEGTVRGVQLAARFGKAVVTGTTGLSPDQEGSVSSAAKAVPIVKAANFSVGICVLSFLCSKAAAVLGEGYDIEIIEAHHRRKKDAPSGTAIMLGNVLAAARGIDLSRSAVYGRRGISGPRGEQEIGIHAVRGGDIYGDHTVLFAGADEIVELSHRASSRGAFATGAVAAAQWVCGKPPGMYGLNDVLQLR
ncbi:MAG TPA: 4-hydroxy-tetrahydrodipicolinate reductase [Verrucomicrobiae bacterium]|nr:4-hydroxy-tetrahydrodipicolinate reductase [Verrucomicrobiae bacterium]